MYAIAKERQSSVLARLKKLPTSENAWTELYVDPVSGEEWIGYYPLSEMHGGGPRYLRTKHVPADWRSWIDACLMSSETDNALGIAIDLRAFVRERHLVVAFLEQRWHMYSTTQRRAFIDAFSFPRNSRDLIGRNLSEIDREWSEEKQLIARIEALKKNA